MIDPFMDATGLAELVRDRQLSAEQLVDHTVQRIQAVNPAVNAVVIPLFDKAKAEARAPTNGPFAGVPYVIKDLTVVSKGDLNTSSIMGVKEAGYRADHDSYFVRRMRDAGFVLIGKASTPEMGSEGTTEPVAWGPCRNPWDLTRTVGGSSGGSAAAVAAGMVSVAHGNDAGGSVRMPASMCGVVGMKPTRGRISSGPMVTDSDNLAGVAHEGLMARSIRDIAATLDVVSGRHPGDAYFAPYPKRPFAEEVGADPGRLRIGVLTHDPAGDFTVHHDVVNTTRAAADVLARLGHDVLDGYPAALTERTFLGDFMKCTTVVQLREIERYGDLIGRPLREEDVEWQTWQYVLQGAKVSGREYAAGIDALRAYAGALERWWEDDGWDLLLTPTAGCKQALIGELKTKKGDPFADAIPMLGFTVPYNVSGQPAISLPLGTGEEGLPIGVQLVAAYGREDVLLRVAAQLEREMPWAARKPSLETIQKEMGTR